MAVITRPEQGQRAPQTDAEPVGPPEPMNVRLANALVTEAPMNKTQLETVRMFFFRLAEMLLVAGPTFSAHRRQAITMHNLAINRINGVNDIIRQRMREEAEGRLLPIEE